MIKTANVPSTRQVLKSVPFLSKLPDEFLDKLVPRVVERAVPKGVTVFREGEDCGGFWIVASGSANIVKIAPDGRVQILETCPPGSMFGLVSAIDGGNCPATVETREASRFVVFPSALIREAVQEHPEIGLGIALHFAQRLRGTICMAASVCLKSVRSRVAAYLLDSIKERGHDPADGSVLINLGVSQEELASRLGTVREVLARTLRSFREQNLIAQRGDSITVLDVNGLELIAAA